jgi:hypothetical protein
MIEDYSCVKSVRILGLGLAFLVPSVAAQDTKKSDRPTSTTTGNFSSAELAKESHNPLGNLREIIFQTDILPNVGPSKKTEVVETIQTVYPFALGDSWKVMTYGIIPVVSQPGTTSRDDRAGLASTSILVENCATAVRNGESGHSLSKRLCPLMAQSASSVLHCTRPHSRHNGQSQPASFCPSRTM